jgi:hypothetical protein
MKHYYTALVATSLLATATTTSTPTVEGTAKSVKLVHRFLSDQDYSKDPNINDHLLGVIGETLRKEHSDNYNKGGRTCRGKTAQGGHVMLGPQDSNSTHQPSKLKGPYYSVVKGTFASPPTATDFELYRDEY